MFTFIFEDKSKVAVLESPQVTLMDSVKNSLIPKLEGKRKAPLVLATLEFKSSDGQILSPDCPISSLQRPTCFLKENAAEEAKPTEPKAADERSLLSRASSRFKDIAVGVPQKKAVPAPHKPVPVAEPDQMSPLDRFSATDLALFLHWRFVKMFRKVHFKEFLTLPWTNPMMTTENSLLAIPQNYIKLVQYFIYQILWLREPLARCLLMESLVTAAVQLRTLGDFYAMSAIACAVSHSSIRRLQITFSKMTPDKRRDLEVLRSYMDPDRNFFAMRKLEGQHEGSWKVPFLPVLFKRLEKIEYGRPWFIGEKVNIAKSRAWFQALLPLDKAKDVLQAEEMDAYHYKMFTQMVRESTETTEEDFQEMSKARETKGQLL